ncbi:MAG: response regulator [Bryobacteraceae bacterium]|jgi:CheY-like chemotaxis protein
MSRILLVDDSPHAQRMGERILSDEGYEVVTVSNADSALIRLEDADPDVVLADAVMPGRTGYDICQYLKMSPRHRHVRVILMSGAQEPIDESRAQLVQADGAIEKPFEASALLAAVKPLAEAARKERPGSPDPGTPAAAADRAPGARESSPFVAVVDAEQVRAAVTLALDATMGTMVDEIARRVLAALNAGKPQAQPAPAPPQPEPPEPALPPPPHTPRGMVRRVTPLRVRTGSILGLDIDNLEPEEPDSQPPE